jgi:hypothetical protein
MTIFQDKTKQKSNLKIKVYQMFSTANLEMIFPMNIFFVVANLYSQWVNEVIQLGRPNDKFRQPW